jgi:Xaa-Pro aminopeptidase
MRYLIDYEVDALERLTVLIVSRDDAVMVLPDFDAAEFSSVEGRPRVVAWTDLTGPSEAIREAFLSLRTDAVGQVALVDDELSFAFLSQLREWLPEEPVLASTVLSDLRVAKTDAELDSIAAAGELVSSGVEFALAHATPGKTEIAVKHEIETWLREAGAESVDFVLVQAGPNSASPHHAADETRLEEGGPVLVDVAVRLEGYFADMTQQVFLGEIPDDYSQHYEVVRRAEEAGVAAAVVGATAHDVAVEAASVIRAAGLGRWMGARVGHGVGLGVHEPPAVVEGNAWPLQPGTVITVEPGIYIPGRYGIRIEDTIVVTEGGPQRLTRAGRPLVVRPPDAR